MADARHEEIVNLIKTPVRPDAPVGDPVRYDEAFERLQAQLDRSGSLTGEETEWRTVTELAGEILKSKSKDLLVLTYFTLGVFEVDGYKGLAAAFEGYIEFLKTFWDSCFPKVKPPQGRLNAVQYLSDRLMPLIELKGGTAKKEPGVGDKEAVHACTAKIEELDKVVAEKFTGMPESPNLMPMIRAFQALRSKVGPLVDPAKAAAEAAAAAAKAAGAPTEEGAPRPAASGGGVVGSFASPAQAMDQVKRIARYLLEQDNKDARAYRLSRMALLGAMVEPKDRFVPPVPPNVRTVLENLAGAGDWQPLLTQAENQFLQTPLWLDLQRFVATALNGMGPMYTAAKQAVILETVALQNRLPGLFDLCFKDGKPFADAATKAWLVDARTEIGAGAAGGGGSNGDRLSSAIGEARKLLTDAKPGDAVSRIAAEMDGSSSRREQFRAQLALARFFMDMNKPALAESLLEGLNAQVAQYNVEEWEPALAAETLQYLFDCLCKNRPRPTPEDLRHRADIFGRLCRLNPAAALKLEAMATPAKTASAPAPAPTAAAAAGAKPTG